MPDVLTGRTSPATAVVWDVLDEALNSLTKSTVDPSAPVSVLDLGGGTGVFAVPLAVRGHTVTVVDPSPDALATLARRASAAGVAARITGIQGDADTVAGLVEPGSCQLVLCHSVLEYVDDPAATARAVRAVLCPGGWTSVLAATRSGAVLARALAGRTAESLAVLTSPDGRWGPTDAVLRRFDADELSGLLGSADLQVESVHGIRMIADVVSGASAGAADHDTDQDGDLLVRLERELAVRATYRGLATQLHVLARRAQR